MKRLLVRLLLFAMTLIVVAAFSIYLILSSSLPQLEGEVFTTRVSSDVVIERDDSGIPTITAATRADLAYATGYVHGQDRFFHMDLTRRKAAGELAEIVGMAAVPVDKRSRIHRFRARATKVLESLSPYERDVLQAYADGVNDGLDGLGAKPFEYFLLGSSPRPWGQADTILVVYAMFIELNDGRAERDISRGFAHDLLPQPAFDWLFPRGTNWDAPLLGEPRGNGPIPTPADYTLSGTTIADSFAFGFKLEELPMPGSNNWAVSGKLTESGAAIVANDMHLGLTTPNIFYRARLRVRGDAGIDLNGLTLPGAPVLIAGSNGHIAWGNTNSYGDWTDAVIVKPGDAPGTYLTPGGQESFVVHNETIVVKGARAEELEVRETIWGPVNDAAPNPDQVIAVSWVAHYENAVTLGHLNLETARNVESALDIANEIGAPPQNFVVGDADGSIGWTIAGKIPNRSGAWLPTDWSEDGGWNGWISAQGYPRIVNPPSGRIWTANARVVDGNALAIIGDGGYDLGARAKQIRDDLFSIENFAPDDMLAIQLDDRALFLERWRDVILDTLDIAAVTDNAARAEFRSLVENWNSQASTSSVGYRLVREFRNDVRRRAIIMLFQPVLDTYGEEWLEVGNQLEGPLWSLVTEKPEHLLSDSYADWDDFLLQAIDGNIERYHSEFPNGLQSRTWGERNSATIRHPLSRAVPFLARWLDMTPDELPGDSNMPRVQSPAFGASERFAVSPGDEENGYLHMPAGQSAHPLSDYYRKGHDDWVQGRPSSFLPGSVKHTLTLKAGE